MTGSTTLFHLQSLKAREQILLSWSQSYIPTFRSTARGFRNLVGSAWLKTSPTLGLVLGFPRAPVHGEPGHGFDYKFLQIPPGDGAEVLEADVIIIGSGCGAGVCAKNIAETGQRVIVVEKGYSWGPEYLPMSENDGAIHLFANGGATASDDASITMISGEVWGGGGTVNWSASLQTPACVRKEWADAGLPFFTSAAFQSSLDRVCERMGVSADHIEHNVNNQSLLEGARKLGYSHKNVPQNTDGNRHYCGYCTLGCGSAEKQGPVVSFLPDAARAGAQFMEGIEVENILFETNSGSSKSKPPSATGISGTWTSRDSRHGVSGSDRYTRSVRIKATRIVVAAGTLNSPLILLRSGLKNPNIGAHLHLHPATLLTAVYSSRPKPINPWEGGILTSLVDEFDNLDGRGHGARVESMTMLPSLALAFQSWRGGLAYKEFCSNFAYMTAHISLTRDRDEGRVYLDPNDSRRGLIAYTPSAYDRTHAVEGLIAAAKIAYVQGAEEIHTSNTFIPVFRRPAPSTISTTATSKDTTDPNDPNDPAFQSFLSRIRTTGLSVRDTAWGSAHQMSSCRMSSHPSRGVVDPRGKVWGVEGVWCADSSVLPSASGVNPMVSTMAVADAVSRWVCAEVGGKVGKEEARL